MREFIVADIERFAIMVDTSCIREIINDGLKRGAAEAIKKRNTLLRLKRELDGAENQIQRDDIMRQLIAAQKDDLGLYQIGIDVVMQVITAAAKNGVIGCVYDFLAPIFQVDPKILAEMPLSEFVPAVREMVSKNNFKDFFDLPGLIQAKLENKQS